MILDHFAQAKADAQKAVKVFLPSLARASGNASGNASGMPSASVPRNPKQLETVRALSLARHVEKLSGRAARGLPLEEPQQNEMQQFGSEIDPVHIRALSAAIASHPETERAKLLHEAHDSLTKWIASHNGRVVVDGKMELAHTPQAAETLAAKIINGAVDDHDARQAALRVPLEPDGKKGAVVPGAGARPDEQLPRSVSGRAPGGNQPQRPAQAPEIVPPGDGKAPAQGVPPQVSPTEVAKVGTRAEDGHLRTQPKNSVPANQKLALDAAPQLDQILARLTSAVPGSRYDRIRPQKATDRLDEKVKDDNDPNTLSDYLGAQIAADSPQVKDALVNALRKNFKVIEVDDQFLSGRQDKAGYPSANVQVQMRNGMTAEVQIVPKEVQERTEESHKFYKAGREAEVKGDHAERDRQWEQAKQIHNEALDAFKERNGMNRASPSATETPADSTSQNQPSLPGYEILGDPIQLGSHTFVRVRPAGSTPATPSPDSNGEVED